jgi:hypothetical protein
LSRSTWVLCILLLVSGLCVGLAAVAVPGFRSAGHPYTHAEQAALAIAGSLDNVNVVSTMIWHKGNQGMLVVDMPTGNVWFIGWKPKEIAGFGEPVFIAKLPLDKIDQATK